MEENQKKPEERLEFLKREEIVTMQKDVARLRETEAQKERERIAALKAKEEKPKPPPPAPAIPSKEERLPPTPRPLIPKPPSLRPSPFKKFLVRGIVLIFCLFLFGFFYWLLAVKKPPVEEVIPPVEEIIPPEEIVVEKPKIIIPPPLISVEETRTSEISTLEEIPEIFSWLIKEELPEESFTRLVIINLPENRLVSLEEMTEAFQIEVPKEIYQKLSPDYTLALYSQRQGKRVAFVTKIKERGGLLDILKNWEAKIVKEGIFLSGQKISALVPYFRDGFWKDVSYRYLTISREDLGICYALFKDDFILTFSWESLAKVIDLLKIKEEVEEEVVPEEEIIEKPEISAPSITERILNWGYHIPTTPRTIDTIVIHSSYNAIGGDVHDMEKVIEEYRMYGVTSHYLITREGNIYQLAPDEAIAYHAGTSVMPDGSRRNLINEFSIGIELIYTKTEVPNEEQYQALAQLINSLRQKYNIPSENILGHNQIAPERKTDPWNFDWEYFKPLLEQ